MAHSQKTNELSQGVFEFGLNLYKQCVATSDDESKSLSPVTVYIALAMALAGARSKTEELMMSALNMKKRDDLSKLEAFVSDFKEAGEFYTLLSVNRIFPGQRTVLDSYVHFVKQHFGTDVTPMDYAKKGAVAEINAWVEKQTQGKLKTVVSEDTFSEDIGMFLITAIYFKADWNFPFMEESTKLENFYKSKSKKVKVNMMHSCREAPYTESKELDCKILELYYKGRGFSVVIILPNKIDGIYRLERDMSIMKLQQKIRNTVNETVHVGIPKFEINSSLNLKDQLCLLGLSEVFDPALADFSGIGEEIFVGNVIQGVSFVLNEKGAEAAAWCGLETIVGGISFLKRKKKKEIVFTADHPFMFMIWDKRLDVPLFLGRYMGP